MKLFSHTHTHTRPSGVSAFTLVEMMISVGIYLALFVGVMIAIQIFGLRVYTLAATKMTATADGRKALNQIRDDIRQAKTLQVGNLGTAGIPTTFAAITNTGIAQGNALQIFATSNTVPYNIYYVDTTTSPTNYLKTYMVDVNNNVTSNILVGYITNTIVFDVEDCNGNVLSNTTTRNHPIYGMNLQFYQWEYPIAYVGPGHALNEYNYYQLRTKVSRRAID